jgi:hypothetical protein
MHANCHAHLILLDLITQIMSGEAYYKLWSSSLCSVLPLQLLRTLLSSNIYTQGCSYNEVYCPTSASGN